ncbi:hypothetical protein IAT40_004099 [Kwoniella sp. CBS 6097]
MADPTVHAAQAAQAVWTLPSTIEPRRVLPDRYTDPSSVLADKLKGKVSDPGRMGVYVCLLDERPHLHPSLQALHRHRLNAHQIPLPPDPINDLPIPHRATSLQSDSSTSAAVDATDDPAVLDAMQQQDVDMSAAPHQALPLPNTKRASAVRDQDAVGAKQEWFTWKFTQEEELRRKAYLPLA